MENVNIIFLTNKADDLNFFNTLPRTLIRSVSNNEVESCKLVENFSFIKMRNEYRFYDRLLHYYQLSNEGRSLIDRIKETAFGNQDFRLIVTVHWGEKDLNEIKQFLKELNQVDQNTDYNLSFSYWGSQAHTYDTENLQKIKEEIIQLADIYESEIIAEIRESIEIFRKSNQLASKKQNKILDELNEEIKFYPDSEAKLTHKLHKVFKLYDIQFENHEGLKELRALLRNQTL
ncbi:MAG: hypothetical protein K9H15_05020 [Bacteroidales bacterium]|nr:hypothetical protein [Bacteroidales bacterium]